MCCFGLELPVCSGHHLPLCPAGQCHKCRLEVDLRRPLVSERRQCGVGDRLKEHEGRIDRRFVVPLQTTRVSCVNLAKNMCVHVRDCTEFPICGGGWPKRMSVGKFWKSSDWSSSLVAVSTCSVMSHCAGLKLCGFRGMTNVRKQRYCVLLTLETEGRKGKRFKQREGHGRHYICMIKLASHNTGQARECVTRDSVVCTVHGQFYIW